MAGIIVLDEYFISNLTFILKLWENEIKEKINLPC